MSEEVQAMLALLMAPGIGRATLRRILAVAHREKVSLRDLIELSPRRLTELLAGGADRAAGPIARWGRQRFEHAGKLLKRAKALGATAVAVQDPGYPKSLTQSLGDDAPPLLFFRGNPRLLDGHSAAVVGARKPSQKAAQLAGDCARTFAKARVSVVSGGCEGVDLAAHEAALEAGGATAVVLPQGMLTYRLPEPIASALRRGRTVIVSEFVPDQPWETHAAVTRNATISALARLVCVIEPKKVGGSIRTARCALEQGKPVFVAPDWASAPAADSLIRAGAMPLVDAHGRLQRGLLIRLSRTPATRGRGEQALLGI